MTGMTGKRWIAFFYAAALALWLAAGALGLARAGEPVSLDPAAFSLVGAVEAEPAADAPAGSVTFLSTDADPQLYWEGEARVDTVTVYMTQDRPSGGVTLYYRTQGQADYSEARKVWADQTAPGVWRFELSGVEVTGLRLDPDSEGGVTSCLSAVALNEPQPLWRRLVPDAGGLLALAAAPLLLAALAGELTELAAPLDKKRR